MRLFTRYFMFPQNWDFAKQNATLENYNWQDLAYGNDKFIAISENGYYSITTNGKTWSEPAKITSDNQYSNVFFSGICYGFDKFYCLTDSGVIFELSTGTSWQVVSSDIEYPYNWKPAYGNNKIIAVSENIAYSTETTNITNWTIPSTISGLNTSFQGITYNDDLREFYAIGYNGRVAKFNNYEKREIENIFEGSGWCDICYDGTKLIALNSSGYTSKYTNGEGWTQPKFNKFLGSHNWVAFECSNDLMIAISKNGYISTKRI